MKKKVKFLMALFLSLTTMFGSTLCYAAETENGSNEVYADEQSDGDIALAFYQQGSVDRYFTFSELGVTMKIRLNYEWDEGDAGSFLSANIMEISSNYIPIESLSECSITTGFGVGSITITANVTYNSRSYQQTKTFYVDGYGDVYPEN